MKRFQDGDHVYFEYSGEYPNYKQPRWDFGEDRGTSGVWGVGTICDAGLEEFTVSFDNPDVTNSWIFSYNDMGKSGWPKLIDWFIISQAPVKTTCVCDSQSIFNFGCPSARGHACRGR